VVERDALAGLLSGRRLRDGSSGGFLETQDEALAVKISANATGLG